MTEKSKSKKPTALVVGGSSGLGLALAKNLVHRGYEVHATGRTAPKEEGITGHDLAIGFDPEHLLLNVQRVAESIFDIDLFIYAAGESYVGTLSKLESFEIVTLANVNFVAPMLFVRKILERQCYLPACVFVTSTSQWTPRPEEPVYAGAKAGLSHFGHSISRDPQVGKVLVLGPSGMNTKMRKGRVDVGVLLEPAWVAGETLQLLSNRFKFCNARILRDPPRVEIVEKT